MADSILSSTATGATISLGNTVAGEIDFGADQDWYRVTLVAGHQYQFDLRAFDSGQGTLDDPFLRLLNGSGAQVAFDDDSGSGLESRITYTAATSGTYYLSAEGFGDTGGTFVAAATDLGASTDVPGTTGTTRTVSIGGQATGTVGFNGDQDWYRVTLTAGQQYRFGLLGSDTGSSTLNDPYLRLLNGAGVELIADDDSGIGLESRIAYTATASGTFYLSAEGVGSDVGTFVLEAEQVTSGGTDVPQTTASTSTVAIGGSVNGTIGVGADQDWYRVTLVAGHEYRFDLEGFDSGNGTLDDPYLRLLSASGALIDFNDDSGGVLDSSITFTPSAGGTYFLSAEGFGSGTGTFQLSATDLGLAPGDAVPGSTGSGATLGVGVSVSGTIDNGSDQDWYQISLVAGHTYRFDLQGVSAGGGSLVDPLLRLLDGAGAVLETNDDEETGGTLDSSIEFTAGSSGTYFLSAQGFGSSTGTFALSAADLDSSLADVPAGTGTGASAVIDGSVTGTIDFGGDQDWYQVSLVAGHGYQFDLLGVDSGQGTLDDPYLRLRNSAGVEVAFDDDSGAVLESSLDFTPALSGTYFVSAQGFGSGDGTFRLDIDDLGPPVDVVPGNNGSASSLAVGASVTGLVNTGGDQDWYQVTLVAGQEYQFDLLGIDSRQGTLDDPYLRLLNSSGAEVAFNDDGGLGLESSITYTASSSGTYFLSAEGYQTDLGSYRLDVVNLSNPVDVPASVDTGSPLWVDYYVTGEIGAAHEEDWYRVTLEAGHLYQFDLAGSDFGYGTLGDPYLRVLDYQGNELFFNDDAFPPSTDSALLFTPFGSVNYFLSAEGYDAHTGTYTLGVSEIDVASDTTAFTQVAVGESVTGTVDVAFDDDWYQLTLQVGHEYRFDLSGAGAELGTLIDPYLRVLDASGSLVDFNDDSGGSLDSSITFTAETSSYFLSAGSFGSGTGTFTLGVTEIGGQTFDGTTGRDALVGTQFDDELRGVGDADLLDGKEGNDYLDGGTGADTLAGGLGDDLVYGWNGNDLFLQSNQESAGDDELFGEDGNDEFHDHFGDNLLDGGDGDDFFSVFIADDGSNFVTGGDGQDTYQPLPGMSSTVGRNYVVTDFTVGIGGDLLDVTRLLEASAEDGYFVEGVSSTASFIRLTQAGSDTRLQWDRDGAGTGFAWATQLTLKNIESDKLTSHNFAGAQEIGSKDDDALSGAMGDDTLIAAAGNDTLNGSGGADVLEGGSGSDTYYVDDTKDVVVETSNAPLPGLLIIGPQDPDANAGVSGITDTVIAAVNYSLATVAFVENLTLTGAAVSAAGNSLANVVTGNAGHNVLTGGAGNDTLSGGAGSDTMIGGTGNDTYLVNAASDRVTEAATGGSVDSVRSSVAEILDANVENLVLTGAGHINGTGNASRNTITGNAGNNLLDGKGGADTLNGLGGNDILAWATTDSYDGGTGTDTLKAAVGNLDLTTVANSKIRNVEQINLTGAGNNLLTLNASDVLDLSSTTNTIKVLGAAGDSVDIVGTFTAQAVAGGFRTYKVGAGFLVVDTDVMVT